MPQSSKNSHEIRRMIGRKIRLRRIRLDITRKDFAERISLSQASVSNIENGKQSLGAERLWEVAVVLGCSPSDLLPPIPDGCKQFEDEARKLEDEEARRWAEDIIAVARSAGEPSPQHSA